MTNIKTVEACSSKFNLFPRGFRSFMETYAEVIINIQHTINDSNKLDSYKKATEVAMAFEHKFRSTQTWMGEWSRMVQEFTVEYLNLKHITVDVEMSSKKMELTETRTFPNTTEGQKELEEYLERLAGLHSMLCGSKESFEMGKGFINKQDDDTAYINVKIK
jgi:hypothetical protein